MYVLPFGVLLLVAKTNPVVLGASSFSGVALHIVTELSVMVDSLAPDSFPSLGPFVASLKMRWVNERLPIDSALYPLPQSLRKEIENV